MVCRVTYAGEKQGERGDRFFFWPMWEPACLGGGLSRFWLLLSVSSWVAWDIEHIPEQQGEGQLTQMVSIEAG